MRVEEKRRAVIVGINKYHDNENIATLQGAENDAKEMYERLIDPNIGGFEIRNEHYLTGENAKCTEIRKAISDVLWKTGSTDLVLFYFSGHGFVDSYGNGYIAPYDMIKNEPFVYGIKMQELRDIMSKAVDKKTIFMILDCCYAGIATKGDDKKDFEENLNFSAAGEGRITLASSEGVAVSREKPDCTDLSDGAPHHHGMFTYHLIRGLDGEAADSNGIISIDSLHKHIEREMQDIAKQRIKYYESSGSLTHLIRIAKSPHTYRQKIEQLKTTINECCTADDIQSLQEAALKVRELNELEPNNAESKNFEQRVDNILKKYQERINAWLNKDLLKLRPRVNEIDRSLPKSPKSSLPLWMRLRNVVDYLSVERINKIEELDFKMLIYLCDYSSINPQTDDTIKSFLRDIKDSCMEHGRTITTEPAGDKPKDATKDPAKLPG